MGDLTPYLPPTRFKGLSLNGTGSDDPIWGAPRLPGKFAEIREWQLRALERIHEAYEGGARIVLLEAPTGSGKTLIGELMRRLLAVRGCYLAETISLQEQAVADFPYARLLKGRGKYPTQLFPHLFRSKFSPLSCAECTKRRAGRGDEGGDEEGDGTRDAGEHGQAYGQEEERGEWICDFCSPPSCPYEVAKNNALSAEFAILNYAYFLTEANMVGRWKGREFVVADEADRIESILLGHASVSISPRMQHELGIEPPPLKTRTEKTVNQTWPEWVNGHAIPKVLDALAGCPASNDVKTIRKRNTYLRLLNQLRKLEGDLPRGNYIYTGWQGGGGTIEFKPVRVADLGVPLLFSHAQRWLLTSATILEPREVMDSLGIPESWCPLPEAFVVMPWTFPVENRKIHVLRGADMTHKKKDTEWPKMAKKVGEIVDRHPDDRILIHTVSYDLATVLMDTVESPRMMTYTSAKQRDEVLDRFRRTPAAVLLAPSMDRGIDLPYDACRVIIVCKVPWANLGDKQINARKYSKGGSLWYTIQCLRTLIQMTGRATRAADDVSTTYLLDTQFVKSIWKDYRHLLPQGWKDAIDGSEEGYYFG